LCDFDTWRAPPSVDFASTASAESAEKQGFRAGSDISLLPRDIKQYIIFFSFCVEEMKKIKEAVEMTATFSL
jgi:hypothetical protein